MRPTTILVTKLIGLPIIKYRTMGFATSARLKEELQNVMQKTAKSYFMLWLMAYNVPLVVTSYTLDSYLSTFQCPYISIHFYRNILHVSQPVLVFYMVMCNTVVFATSAFISGQPFSYSLACSYILRFTWDIMLVILLPAWSLIFF